MCPEVLVPQPKPRTAPSLVSTDGRTYPLRAARLRARAEAGLAYTTLVQEFDNPYDEPLEVIYTMPLPADGAVLGYLVRMGDRVIRGEIETRENAEAAYKEALYAGKTAGLLEENRADTFEQRLGNLPARTKAEIEIDVLHPLAFLLGTADAAPAWEFRFPTVVSTRYQGAQGRVPDAESLDPNRAPAGDIPTRLTLDLRVADASASAATSPSHPLSVLLGADAVHVHLAEGALLDRDLVLRWPAATPEVGVSVAEGPGLPGDKGRYALVTVTPPAVPATTYHRDLTILIDASGSMDGMPIACAKQVAGELLRSLTPGDRFEVMAFAGRPESLTGGFQGATEKSVGACLRKLASLQASGGTEMGTAIDAALRNLRPDSQRQVVLLTDGYIGFEDEIVERIRTGRAEGVRLHAVGIGSAPNRTLTQSASRAGRGIEVLVTDESEAADAAARLRAATALPVLTDLTIGGTAVRAFAPAKPRDVFAGQPVVIAVELREEGGTLEVSGRLAGAKEAWGWRMEVAGVGGAAGATAPTDTRIPIGALYGRERIADIEAGIGLAGERQNLDEAIEAVGLRHRIVSRRTSLVAIAETPSVDPREPRRRERIAVEVPYGVSAEGVGLIGGADPFALFELGSIPRGMGVSESHVSFLRVPKATLRLGKLHMLSAKSAEPEEAIPAAFISWDEDGLVLELTVPHADFELPEGTVHASLNGKLVPKAEVDWSKSSRKGPHAEGTLVRLALRWPRTIEYAEGGALLVLWTDPASKGKSSTLYTCTVTVPGRPGRGGNA